MLPTLKQQSLALQEGRDTSSGLTQAALARAADPAGEGARVFTRVYA
ncbi:amidase, partial [Bordetella pertussis]